MTETTEESYWDQPYDEYEKEECWYGLSEIGCIDLNTRRDGCVGCWLMRKQEREELD